MSREADFTTRMLADAPLVAILTGGIYKAETVGPEGITRETTPAAFSSGFLLPCALVKQRGNIPTGFVEDYNDLTTSARQVVEIWLYQDRTFTAIDTAMARTYILFQGHQMAETFEIRLADVLDRMRDSGALEGASMARQDWQVENIVT